jgi:hypothetical protein
LGCDGLFISIQCSGSGGNRKGDVGAAENETTSFYSSRPASDAYLAKIAAMLRGQESDRRAANKRRK